jgi:Fe2+ or Zn2+ uptake regulation protein
MATKISRTITDLLTTFQLDDIVEEIENQTSSKTVYKSLKLKLAKDIIKELTEQGSKVTKSAIHDFKKNHLIENIDYFEFDLNLTIFTKSGYKKIVNKYACKSKK